jgi:hypothetical protein
MVTVREDKRRLIRAALINNPDAGEIELYCLAETGIQEPELSVFIFFSI